MATGTCAFDWTGLQALLHNDMVIRVRSQVCPNSKFLSSVTLDCVGTDCSSLLGVHPCNVVNFCII